MGYVFSGNKKRLDYSLTFPATQGVGVYVSERGDGRGRNAPVHITVSQKHYLPQKYFENKISRKPFNVGINDQFWKSLANYELKKQRRMALSALKF